ncbi:hypothetical protein J2T13_000192 [Paenibacillus sp. DS2015]|uniref:hypothetical protein n=1 Tax=Paenibacillus sp. DS2015 TaxID=3373917 RepID=UPI003D1965D1
MRIVETRNIDDDGYGGMELSIATNDDKGGVDFCAACDCPEDNTFHRDLKSALGIRRLLVLAYEAGKRGEDYEYEFVDESEKGRG